MSKEIGENSRNELQSNFRTEPTTSSAPTMTEDEVNGTENNQNNHSGNKQKMTSHPNNIIDDVQTRRAIQLVSRSNSLVDPNSGEILKVQAMNRVVSYQPSITTISMYGNHHQQPDPPSSTPEEKWKNTRRYFAVVTAISYAIFLVVFGAIAFVTDAATENRYYPLPEVFAIYMISVGILYFLFLFIDVRLHIRKAKKTMKERENRIKQYEEQMNRSNFHLDNNVPITQTFNGNVNVRVPLQDIQMEPIKPVSHRYCFMTGRHGEFLYLKLGATWFCFGLLVHSALVLTYQSVFVAAGCSNALRLVVEIMFPIYSLLLLFFIFKYINIVINEYRGIARFFLMHAIGTSLAFWIYTIVRETADAIRLKEKKEEYVSLDSDTVYVQEYLLSACPEGNNLNIIYRNFAPYLYPFIIEFNILVVGIFYMMWANINHCPKKLSAKGHNGHSDHHKIGNQTPSDSSEHCKELVDHDSQFKSTGIIYADCHKSNRGLFLGLMLMILTITFIILLFVAIADEAYVDAGILMDNIFELVVMSILIIGALIGYYQTSELDINPHPISKLDDFLLFVAIPAFLSETIFSMVPAVINGSILNIFNIILQLIQVLIQTPWIIDALRRCANSADLRKRKPGREVVTFMTVANVSLWIYMTFSVRNVDLRDERYTYYGDILWSILNHLSLPLIMFYRFHASVCLVDIWRHSYEISAGH